MCCMADITSSGRHYIFLNPRFISPWTLPPPLSLPVSESTIYLFYMNSSSYIMLHQFTFISAHFLCPVSYSHYFSWPTFHLFLQGVFFK